MGEGVEVAVYMMQFNCAYKKFLFIVRVIACKRRITTMTDNLNASISVEPCARHFERCELVLAAIDTLDKPTLEDIVSAAGLPPRTVHAIFKRLTDQHRVVIERVNGRRHGYYEVADWGNLNRDSIVTHIQRKKGDMEHILPQDSRKECAPA